MTYGPINRVVFEWALTDRQLLVPRGEPMQAPSLLIEDLLSDISSDMCRRNFDRDTWGSYSGVDLLDVLG